MTLEGVVSGLVGALATALGMTWKVAQWARDMAKLEKKFDKHEDSDELFFREARETWIEEKVWRAHLEGMLAAKPSVDSWEEDTKPSGHMRAKK